MSRLAWIKRASSRFACDDGREARSVGPLRLVLRDATGRELRSVALRSVPAGIAPRAWCDTLARVESALLARAGDWRDVPGHAAPSWHCEGADVP